MYVLANRLKPALGEPGVQPPINYFLMTIRILIILAFWGAYYLKANTIDLPNYVVATERSYYDYSRDIPIRSWALNIEDGSLPSTLDQIVSENLAFSFFRRQNAEFANPTTQAANLRFLSATAASRALITKDGIPQNDPFGGWINWARYNDLALSRLHLQNSATGASWGNQSAGGVIHLHSTDIPSTAEGRLRIRGDSEGGYGASIVQNIPYQEGGLQIALKAYDTDGAYVVHPDDRGPIDQETAIDYASIGLKNEILINESLRFSTYLDYFEESRNNGTPLANNSTEALDIGLRLHSEDTTLSWTAILYYQQRTFENQFTSVNTTRTGENPVLNQYDIPGEGIGGSLVFNHENGSKWNYTFGTDFRSLSGETNEDFSFGLDDRRQAGGDQWLAGVFGSTAWQITDNQSVTFQTRLDYWSIRNGNRTETALTTNTITRNETYTDRDGIEPTVSAKYLWDVDPQNQIRLSVGHTFRLPNINELYRPFRVRIDITEANPELEPEKYTFIELGWNGSPNDSIQIDSSVYHYWISDAVANVFQFSGPGPSPGGFVPNGGSFNRKENIDESTVLGWQTLLEWKLSDAVALNFQYLYTQSKFEESTIQPQLDGKRFPQVPEHKLSAALRWQLDNLQINAEGIHVRSQFDDPLNNRILDDYIRLDFDLSYTLNERMSASAGVNNATDEIILTGRASNGIRSIAQPRTYWVSLSTRW